MVNSKSNVIGASAPDESQSQPKNWRLKALHWRAEHPRLYNGLKREAKRRAKAKQCFGINQLREMLRRGEITGEGVPFCNSISPYIARFLLHDIPALAPYIKCRPTKW